MKGFCAFVVLLLIAIVGFGFYRDWFHISSENEDHKSNLTISVDKGKINEDEQKAKDKVHDLGHKVKEETGKRTGTDKDEDKDKVQDSGQKVKEKTGDRSGKVDDQDRRP
jgi:hypothetical protein